MKNHPSLARLARRFVLFLVMGGTGLAARAQVTPTQLDPFVTTATRTAADPRTVGTVVEVISADDLLRRQDSSLSHALGNATGAPLFASGALGATTSLFLRGANSNQTLFLVDGVRFNDPNTDYFVFLGGACVSACDSLEIAHGPQSTLYGGEAVGGVVSLRAQRGSGAPQGRIAAEAGSFGTLQGAVSAQAELGKWAYNFSAQGGRTENQRDNNAFDSLNTTLRLDRTLSEQASVGGTLRWFHGQYGDPGDRFTNDPDNETREDNLLATVFADVKLSPVWSTHSVLGGQNRRFVAESPRAGRATTYTFITNRRVVLDSQTTYRGWEKQQWTAGFTAEANHTRNTGFGDINKHQSLLAFFVQDQFSPAPDLYLTAGLRSDDFDTFGRATTGRGTVAWLVAQRAVKLRASYGTAFRSPSFLDLYGQSAFYVGNPGLKPEKAQGWDAGVDYYLPEKRGTLSVTWFETNYDNLIVSDFTVSPSTVTNVERARTRGIEFSAKTTLPGAVDVRVGYTYLEAENLTKRIRLLRRPRHSFNADVVRDFGHGVTVGAGVVHIAQREDIDARTFATIDGEDYTVARLYVSWQINSRWAFKVRGENLLREHYEEVNGYPALGFGAFAGVEWRW